MAVIPGQVYMMYEQNQPMPHTIVENAVYERNGYTVMIVSMGTGTEMSPERLRHPALYTVIQGEVGIAVRGSSPRSLNLKVGEFWYREPNKLCGFSCNEDTIFAVLTTHQTVNIPDKIRTGEICELEKYISAKPKEKVEDRIIDDPIMKGYLVALGAGYVYPVQCKDDVCFIAGVKGRGSILIENKNMPLTGGQGYLLQQNKQMKILTAAGMKLLVLHFPL
jgi:quercetin dioxygenase-like cupin family protein